MTDDVYLAVRHLLDVVAANACDQCVSVEIMASYTEFTVSYNVRTPEGHDGITMKNIKGEWIR